MAGGWVGGCGWVGRLVYPVGFVGGFGLGASNGLLVCEGLGWVFVLYHQPSSLQILHTHTPHTHPHICVNLGGVPPQRAVRPGGLPAPHHRGGGRRGRGGLGGHPAADVPAVSQFVLRYIESRGHRVVHQLKWITFSLFPCRCAV